MRRPIGRYSAVVIDCLCVLVFVVIGRASHTKGETIGGIASTAWPFLGGLLCGWLVFLGIFLLGWRAGVQLRRNRRRLA